MDSVLTDLTDLESKLNLEPFNNYEDNVEAVERLAEGEYDTVLVAAHDMHPRVAHEVFKYREVDEDHLDEIVDVLENQEPLEGWRKTLFDTGYRSGYPDLSMDSPYMNYRTDISFPGEDELPAFYRMIDGYKPVVGWFSRGRDKRAADGHYGWSVQKMMMEFGGTQL